MGSNLPFMFALFTVAVVVGHAALSPELYWKKVLPGTSMPKAIRESLNPEHMEDKSTSVDVGKGGVNVNAGKVKPGGNTHVSVGHGHVGVTTGKPGKGTTVGVGKGGVSVGTGKGKPVYVRVKPGYSPFSYRYAATETQLKDDPNVALFFLEKDLVPGKTMNLHFTKTASPVSFLPREKADSIPFSSREFKNILSQLSIKPNSEEANIIRKTVTECEEPGMSGEQRYCATSLESMVDFSTKILGNKNIKAVSTESNEDTQIKRYKIEDSVKSLTGDEKVNAPSVVCHKQDYVYAVFLCHSTKSTKAYVVPLKSEDGTEVKAVAVCHKDTSKWNPKHLAFQVLKVKPGTVPICHFLPEDHVVWYQN